MRKGDFTNSQKKFMAPVKNWVQLVHACENKVKDISGNVVKLYQIKSIGYAGNKT